MLYLIGLGLDDEKDLSQRAIEIAKNCECYLETYTSKWFGDFEKLKKLIGKNIIKLGRKDMEEESGKLIELSKKKDVAIFVMGDPLAATTHIDLVLEARRAGITIKIIHNTSILNAVGETGLQLYKFGKTASITFSEQIENVRNAIEGNKRLGMHTLLLLDIDIENGKYMSIKEGIEILLKNGLVKEDEKIIGASKIGTENAKIIYRIPKELMEMEFGTPGVIIIPGELHFKEEEFLEILTY